MIPDPVLEVVVTSAEEAVAAVAGGADRLEVATDMHADGMTPALAEFRRVRASVDVPLRVMLRDHGVFRAPDPERLRDTAAALRAAGADAFVLGFLTPEAALDLPAMTAVLSAVPGCRWTFHRAMDHAADRAAVRSALHVLPGLGTILTAGSVTGGRGRADRPPLGTGRARPRRLRHGGRPLLPGHVHALRAHGIRAFHIGDLHVHLVPRREADHLHRPWQATRADAAALAATRRRILDPGSRRPLP
ncbi:copper homeostasis protein CutC [Streptomyces sp. XY332]|uniref:copper homeostasis protein CutC n=1 Tax=Streptomyces sp. XY332 TaxID=1415561 RepID=UPI0006B1E30E|nr:copper homeostasis protein CutC [Streptomyces sp. XY332]